MAMAGMTVDLSSSLTSFVLARGLRRCLRAGVVLLLTFILSSTLARGLRRCCAYHIGLSYRFPSSALFIFIEPIRGLRHCLRTGYVILSVNFPLHFP